MTYAHHVDVERAWDDGWRSSESDSTPAYDTDAERAAWDDARTSRDTGTRRRNPHSRKHKTHVPARQLDAFDLAGLDGRCAKCRRPIRPTAIYCDTVCSAS